MKNQEQSDVLFAVKEFELLSRIQTEHDADKAFDQLLNVYSTNLSRTIRNNINRYQIHHLEFSDVQQEVFSKIFLKLKAGKFDAQQHSSFLNWSKAVIKNHIIDLYRSSDNKMNRRSNFRSSEYLTKDYKDQIPNPEELFLYEELKERVFLSLKDLDENKSKVVLEHVFGNKSFSAISKELEVNQNTVQGWYFRWKEKFRKQFQSKNVAA